MTASILDELRKSSLHSSSSTASVTSINTTSSTESTLDVLTGDAGDCCIIKLESIKTKRMSRLCMVPLLFVVFLQTTTFCLGRARDEGSTVSRKVHGMDQRGALALLDGSSAAISDIGREWEPLEAFNRWKAWHSQEALEAEYLAYKNQGLPPPTERKFIVAQYSCPEQAGNLLHNFASALAVAIVTNRTLVYEYRATTRKFVEKNKKNKCDNVLQKAEWLPPFNAWARRYNLGPQNPATNPDHVHVKPDMHATQDLIALYQEDPTSRLVPQETTKLNYEARMWTFGKLYHLNEHIDDIWDGLVNMNDDFGYAFFSQLLGFEGNKYSQVVVTQLWSQGSAFLYGMLFRSSFSFTEQLLQSVEHYMVPKKDASAEESRDITIALHSRHPHAHDEGSDVSAELACLDDVLTQLRKDDNPNAPCTLFIMSDRVKTVDELQKAAADYQCKVVHVSATADLTAMEGTDREVQEHGPFAGAGYFRDWIVTSQARSAMISGYRSSSALVYELMTYDGMLEGSITERPLRCTTF